MLSNVVQKKSYLHTKLLPHILKTQFVYMNSIFTCLVTLTEHTAWNKHCTYVVDRILWKVLIPLT